MNSSRIFFTMRQPIFILSVILYGFIICASVSCSDDASSAFNDDDDDNDSGDDDDDTDDINREVACEEDKIVQAGCDNGWDLIVPCIDGFLSDNTYCQKPPDKRTPCDDNLIEPGACEDGLDRVTLCRGGYLSDYSFCVSPDEYFGMPCTEDNIFQGVCPEERDLVIPCDDGVYTQNTYCQEPYDPVDHTECETDERIIDGCGTGIDHIYPCVDGFYQDDYCVTVQENTPDEPDCEAERTIVDGCEDGDLITECIDGEWGQTWCKKHESGDENDECVDDLYIENGCDHGDLVTECIQGYYGETECVKWPSECENDEVIQNGCEGGDLVTLCEDGFWGDTVCEPWPPECLDDRIEVGGCEDGNLVTPCEDGFWGEPYCKSTEINTPYEMYDACEGLTNDSLINCLNKLVTGHTSLGYSAAKEEMFSYVSNDNGYIECVYTGRRIQSYSTPNSTDMNCEHSWPQSKGAKTEPARSDIHHLYPSDSSTNSRRSNYPFCEVVNVDWTQGGSSVGTNSSGTKCFEPRDAHKGDVARSMMYFSVRYGYSIDGDQEYVFKKWNMEDPPDDWEMQRQTRIESIQNNRNPFVDVHEFAEYISDF